MKKKIIVLALLILVVIIVITVISSVNSGKEYFYYEALYEDMSLPEGLYNHSTPKNEYYSVKSSGEGSVNSQAIKFNNDEFKELKGQIDELQEMLESIKSEGKLVALSYAKIKINGKEYGVYSKPEFDQKLNEILSKMDQKLQEGQE